MLKTMEVRPLKFCDLPSQTRRLPVNDLQPAPDFRNRLDMDHAHLLASFDGELPPILVAWPECIVIDGLHRLHAAKIQGRTHIQCELFEGPKGEEFVEFVKRNTVHGLPLTLNERRSAARRILAANPQYSDRRIAGICALSAGVIARMRTSTVDCEPTGHEITVRTGCDGRARPVDRNALRQRIAEELSADATASLRQIAARTGASPETVRSVRRALAENTDSRPDSSDAERRNDLTLLFPLQRAQQVRDWTNDAALVATDDCVSFAEWFNRTAIDDECHSLACCIPLSRIYEVAEEARRRAAKWAEFGREVESRSRRRGAVAS